MKEDNGIIYYDTSEAANYLGISKDMLYHYTKRGQINRYQFGFLRTAYYRLDELEDFRNFLNSPRKYGSDDDDDESYDSD